MRETRLFLAVWAALLVGVIGAVAGTSASADTESMSAEEFTLPSSATEPGTEQVTGPTTEPEAADSLPHSNLDRGEALELLTEVFGRELEAPSGPFDDLHVEKFLSNNVALIAAGEQPESTEGGPAISYKGPTLMESTVPLRVEGASGENETVELSLDRSDGELQPENPLVEVNVPDELGDGVELPETGVTINLQGADEAIAPSNVEGSAAFYPNVDKNTDLVVAPTPTGVETLTQVRSADAVAPQVFDLSLPTNATLEETKEGGALIVKGGGTPLVEVAPPDAIDASGTSIPVEMEVEGSSLILTPEPPASTKFPILIDPLYQTYKWEAGKPQSGIHFSNTGQEEWTPQNASAYYEYPWCNPCQPYKTSDAMEPSVGLAVYSGWYQVKKGEHAAWIYTVPRYFKDPGEKPTSFINNLTFTGLTQWANSPYHDPYLEGGLWDIFKNEWGSPIIYHEGLEGHSLNDANWEYKMPNLNGNVNDKIASVGLWATQDTPNGPGNVHVTAATVELAEATDPEKNKPVFGSISPPLKWVNQTPAPVEFSVTDTGLGVYALKATSGEVSWTTPFGCTGVGGNACPRSWYGPSETQAALKYDPSVMAQGVNNLKVVAEDPLGHASSPATVQIRVDHSAPSISLSGSLTEQDILGTRRSSYTLNAIAADGSEGASQSGVGKLSVEVDGKVTKEVNPGCSTQNCTLGMETLLEANQYPAGVHTVKVNATDAVGITATKTLSVELHPTSPPSLALSGSMTEQASVGTSRPRYVLKASAAALAGSDGSAPYGAAYSNAFGTPGTAAGQFNHPADVAYDAQGNLWVVDKANNRIEQFTESGGSPKAFGSLGSTGGKLNSPSGIVVDSSGNVWVTDTGNTRVVEFGKAGEFLATFGTNVNKTKVEAAGTQAEKNLCTAASKNVCQAGTAGSAEGQMKEPIGIAASSGGNLYVVEKGNGRVEKFSPTGAILANFGGPGSGSGQLLEPTAVAVAPDASIWVADSGNNRIQHWNSTFTAVSAYGKEGTANGEFKHPDAIDVDPLGNVFVADQGNGRVQEFSENGVFLTRFGSGGTNPGQLTLTDPAGIAANGKGEIWVTDTGNNRVEKWIAPKVPAYSNAFGTPGTAAGQFNHPADVAYDAQGNLWVVDKANNRIEQFTESGGSPKAFGSLGSTGGKLNSPSGIVVDSSGNVWVTDTGNTRVVEFGKAGEFLATFGTNVNKTKVEAAGTQAEKNLCTAASKNVCQAGTAGSAEGQMKEPIGIAASSGGNLYVVEKGNGRVEKFSPTGAILANFGGPGSGSGQLLEPTAVAVAPDASIWVADSGNNRIQHWNSTFTAVSAYGKEGTANGEFKHPDAIDVDPLGNVFVADQGNGRVQEFSENGVFLTRFGSGGTNPGQLTLTDPAGIAANGKGEIWVTDTGNNRVEKWTQQTFRTEISTSVTIDGKQVSVGKATCFSEPCPLATEWILEAPVYPGGHKVTVESTDGLGRSTAKTLTIEMKPDTVQPTLEVGGSLFAAPEGWVEQDQYLLTSTATDAGYGLTSLIAKIDGKVVASWSSPCPDGACKGSFSQTLDMSVYAGGSHPAEIVAKDGAGNTQTKQWSINVDPEGHVSSAEAIDTLEAADETSESTVVALPSEELEPEQMEGGDNPKLIMEGGKLESEGVPDTTTLTTNPANGFSIEGPNGTTTFTPKVGESPGETKVASEVAGVTANTQSSVDTIIRPVFNGAQTFQAIRTPEAPETYSWTVKLAPGQKLTSVSTEFAQVEYEDGTVAFLITAEGAHDATGVTVPVSLSVSGNVLTLKVEFKKSQFTYPIIAGQGWETSYEIPTYVELPEDEYEIKQREEEEKLLREGEEPTKALKSPLSPEMGQELIRESLGSAESIAAPPYPSGGGAGISKLTTFTVDENYACGLKCGHWKVYLRNPSFIRGWDWAHWEYETQVHCGWNEVWWLEPVVHLSMPEPGCSFTGPMKVWKGENKHLTIWGRYKIAADVATEWAEWQEKNFLALQIWIWPNGFQQNYKGHWTCTDPFFC